MANPNGKQLIKSIPNAPITKELVDLQIICAICLHEFRLNESGVRKLKCDHLYHGKCLIPWLQRNASCSYCRAPLSKDNQNTESIMDQLATLTVQMQALREDMEVVMRALESRQDSEEFSLLGVFLAGATIVCLCGCVMLSM